MIFTSKQEFKDKLLEFIKLYEPNIKEILEHKLIDYDGEYGYANEYYEVNCLIAKPNPNYVINNMLGEKEKLCRVNTKIFNDWVRKINAVTWS